jgi:hypothetical protein
MDEKWDVFTEGRVAFLHRSQTGNGGYIRGGHMHRGHDTRRAELVSGRSAQPWQEAGAPGRVPES